MKYFSTFTGIGGFELAIHNTFPDAECIGWSEIDTHAIKTFTKNFPGLSDRNYGDIQNIICSDIPDFDLFVGGSSCQDLSISKKDRKSLRGKKSRLFFDYIRILKEKRPKYFILENVASMSNDARDEMTEHISSAYGRVIQPMKINSGLLSCQNRWRYYWFPWEAEQPQDMEIKLYRNNIVAHAWSKSARKDGSFDERIRKDGKTNTLTCSINGTESIVFFPEKEVDFAPRKVWSRKDLYYHNITKDMKLTPNEAEFCQTFPKNWTEGVSLTQRYRQLGNAVTVKVIAHILKGIK